VFLFWAVFVLTRPFGATMGDLLMKSHQKGGLDLGPIGSSAFLGSVLMLFVIYTTFKARTSSTDPVILTDPILI
jgi:uncharacterized membrane-anchored protein